MRNCHIIHKLNKTWRLKPVTKGKKVLKVSQTLNFQLLSKINTMFNGKKRKEKRNGFGKIKQKKERKKRNRKYSFMYEFRCENEKA